MGKHAKHYFGGIVGADPVVSSTPRASGVFNLGALGADVAGTPEIPQGSTSFDGTDDHIEVGAQAQNIDLSGAFTVEAWVRLDSTSNNMKFFDLRSATAALADTLLIDYSAGFRFFVGGSNQSSNPSATVNTWYHIAAVRDGSNNVAFFVDGSRVASTTSSLDFTLDYDFVIGINGDQWSRASPTIQDVLDGYMSEARISNTARYDPTSTSVSIPTAQFADDTNTLMLLRLNEATLSDVANSSRTITANGVSNSTSVYKFATVPAVAAITRPMRRWGGMTGRSLVESTAAVAGDANWNDVTLLLDGSSSTDLSPASPTITPSSAAPTAGNSGGRVGGQYIDFNGSNNYYNVALNQAIGSSGDPFTVECWVYFDAHSNDGVFQILRSGSTLDASADSNTVSLAVAVFNNQWVVYDDTGGNQYGSSVATGTWHHVAIVYDGSDLVFYLNGAAAITKSNWTANLSSTGYPNIAIGGYYSTGFVMDGRIQDFRVTKGVARDIAAGFSNGTPISGGGWDAAFPTNQAVAASTNVPTTGVLSLAEHYQGTL